MKLLSVAGYTRKEQIKNTKIKEKRNIFNLNNKILKSRSQWQYHILRMEHKTYSGKNNVNTAPQKKTKHRAPTVKWRGQHAHQEGGTD
jgi:hypothetical protein